MMEQGLGESCWLGGNQGEQIQGIEKVSAPEAERIVVLGTLGWQSRVFVVWVLCIKNYWITIFCHYRQ